MSRRSIAVAVLAAALTVATAACGSRATFDPPIAAVIPNTVPPTTSPAPAAPAPGLTGEDVELAAPLPEPAAAPEPPPGVPAVGRIAIPRLGLDAPLLESEDLAVLAYGPGHREGSALPGQVGNVVVAGHRVTRTRPFRHLDQLQPGDAVVFSTATGTYQYEFVAHDVVAPTDVYITAQPYGYIATLYACHPPGSARSRLVAYLRLVSAPQPGQPDPATVPVVPLPLA